MTIYTPGKLTLAKTFTWNETVWNPSMLSTALWLDAADATTVTTSSGLITEWRDKSGNSRHASQSTPSSRPALTASTLNGQSVITFDGSNDYLRTTIFSLSQPVSYFCVCKSNKTTGVNLDRSYVFDGGFQAVGSSADRHLLALFGNVTSKNSIYAGSWLDSGVSISLDPIIGSLRFNGGSSSITINSTTITGDAGANTQSFGLTLGANYQNNYDFFSGYIAELVVVSNATEDAARRTQGYLAHKWGLTANLPSDHPYKTVGPTS